MLNPSGVYYQKKSSADVENCIANPKKIVSVVKSEIINIINNYLSVNSDNVYLDIIVNKDGLYELRLRAISSKIRLVNSFSD